MKKLDDLSVLVPENEDIIGRGAPTSVRLARSVEPLPAVQAAGFGNDAAADGISTGHGSTEYFGW